MNEVWYDSEDDQEVCTGTRTGLSDRTKGAVSSCSATSKRTLLTPTEPQKGRGSTKHALPIQCHPVSEYFYLQNMYSNVIDFFYLQSCS